MIRSPFWQGYVRWVFIVFFLFGMAYLSRGMAATGASTNPYTLDVRVTFYTLRGVVQSCPFATEWECAREGYWTQHGYAACSWNIATYSTVVMPDGREFICMDRGLLGWSGHIDIWVPDWYTGIETVEAIYGTHARVVIYPPAY